MGLKKMTSRDMEVQCMGPVEFVDLHWRRENRAKSVAACGAVLFLAGQLTESFVLWMGGTKWIGGGGLERQ